MIILKLLMPHLTMRVGFFKIKPQDIEELANLLDSEAYKKVSES